MHYKPEGRVHTLPRPERDRQSRYSIADVRTIEQACPKFKHGIGGLPDLLHIGKHNIEFNLTALSAGRDKLGDTFLLGRCSDGCIEHHYEIKIAGNNRTLVGIAAFHIITTNTVGAGFFEEPDHITRHAIREFMSS